MRLVLIVLECDTLIGTSRLQCTYIVCHEFGSVKISLLPYKVAPWHWSPGTVKRKESPASATVAVIPLKAYSPVRVRSISREIFSAARVKTISSCSDGSRGAEMLWMSPFLFM